LKIDCKWNIIREVLRYIIFIIYNLYSIYAIMAAREVTYAEKME
jgi:hypothetical protein